MIKTDAPALQTLSYNGRVGERSGVGAIVFNDVNGYHSQFGFKATYAHHIMFSRDEVDLNQLSFGVNVGVNQSQLDETDFHEFWRLRSSSWKCSSTCFLF